MSRKENRWFQAFYKSVCIHGKDWGRLKIAKLVTSNRFLRAYQAAFYAAVVRVES